MHNMHVISKLSSNHLCAGINKYVSLFIIIIIIILIIILIIIIIIVIIIIDI